MRARGQVFNVIVLCSILELTMPYRFALAQTAQDPSGTNPTSSSDGGGGHVSSTQAWLVQTDQGTTGVKAPANELAQSSPSSSGSQSALEEIVVTAQRREEKLSDVPMSITAFSQESMDQQGLQNIDDLTRVVPGVTFIRMGSSESSNYNDENSAISIRGVSSNTGYPTTGVYIDDTPIISRLLADNPSPYPALFDLERVEVLKGPQGTLFGAASMGGAVRFITPDPSLSTYSGYAKAEVGQIERGGQNYEVGAAFGGPIIDGVLGFRISASFREDGGWVDRVAYNPPPSSLAPCTGCIANAATVYTGIPAVTAVTESNANWHDTTTFRAALKWQPADGLTIEPSFYFQTLHINDTAAYWMNISDPSNDRYYNGNQGRDSSTDPWEVGAIKVLWTLPWGNLTSNTSYFSRDQHNVSDYSQWIPTLFFSNEYGGIGNTSFATDSDSQRNFTQELRLSSSDTQAALQWTAGLYYTHAHENSEANIFSSELAPAAPNYAAYLGPIGSVLDKQFAAFGEVSVKLPKAFSFTAGVRYSILEVGTNGEAIYQSPYFGGNSTTITATAGTNRPFTPRFVLNYQPNGDSLYYASASEGFRTGIPQIPFSSAIAGYCGTQAPGNVGPDSLWQYEIGSKMGLLDKRMQVNASVYYIQWKNTQQLVSLTCGLGFAANVGTVIGKGAEVTLAWRATDELTAGFTGAYTDSVYEDITSLPGASGGSYLVVKNGDHLPASPLNLDANAEYVWRTFAKRPYIRLDYQFATAQRSLIPYSDPANAPNADPALSGLPEIRILSVRSGLRFNGFDVSLFVQNALDYHTPIYEARDDATSPVNGITPNFDTNFYGRGFAPRTFGLTTTYRF
jgi:outer membrane receptor protein involved in Fe transport